MEETQGAAVSAIVDEALKDRTVRDEIRSILFENQTPAPANDVILIEPLIDAREAAKILGTSPAAVRAAAFRKTIPSVHVGRLLRFKRSDLDRMLRG